MSKTGIHLQPSKILIFLLSCVILVPRIRLGVNWFTLDDLIPLGVAILGVIAVLQTGKLPNRVLLIFLVSWSVIGALSSLVNTQGTSEFISSFAKGALRPLNSLFIVIMTFKLLKDNPENVTFALKWIARIGTALGSFAVLSYGFSVVAGRALFGLAAWRRGSATGALVPGRFVGTSNVASNFIGAYFLMIIPVTLTMALVSENPREKRFYFYGVVVQVFGMIVTFTRSSLIALVLVTIGLLIILKKKALIRFIVGAGAVIGAIITFAVPEYILRFTSDGTGRLFLWSVGLRMMFDNPILGVGFNRYMTVVRENLSRYPVVYEPHNSWILMGAEGGILMFLTGVMLVVVYGLTVYRAFRSNSTVTGRVLIAGLLAGSTGYVIQNLTNDILYLPHLTTYYWFFFALALNMPGNRNAASTSTAGEPPQLLAERVGV